MGPRSVEPPAVMLAWAVAVGVAACTAGEEAWAVGVVDSTTGVGVTGATVGAASTVTVWLATPSQ